MQSTTGDKEAIANNEQYPNSSHCYSNAMNRRGEKPKEEISNQQRGGGGKVPAIHGGDERLENGKVKAVLRRRADLD